MQKKAVQKTIFFILKTIIAVLSFVYIWIEIKKNNNPDIPFPEFNKFQFALLALVVILMPLNWFIESVKWKYLIRKLERISIGKSFKAVFTGITFAIFTPNRIGELAGRIFVLKKENRTKGVFVTATGSLSQMMVTIIFGVISGAVFLFLYESKITHINPNSIFIIKLISISILFLGIYVLFNLKIIERFLKKMKVSDKIISSVEVLTSFSRVELFNVLLYSSFRYFVFMLQFYLLLLVFNVEINFEIAVMTITLTYLVSSVVPSFTLTEIGVRGSAAIFFMSMFSVNIPGIIAATALLWMINLAIPAIIGVFLFYLTKI